MSQISTHNTRLSARGATRGFTLVEMIVVIAITVGLVALLLPAFTEARRQAKILLCQSIMRQQGICFNMYITDCKDYMAAVGTPHFWDSWANNDGNGMFRSRDTALTNAFGRTGIAFQNKYNSCPYFGTTDILMPNGMGWFYWQGYIDPVPSRSTAGTAAGYALRAPVQMPLMECPDAQPYSIGGGGAGYWRNVSSYGETIYQQFSRTTLALASRNLTTYYWDSMLGGFGESTVGDCNIAGGTTSYFYRGWMVDPASWGAGANPANAKKAIKARSEDWTPDKAILVDSEGWSQFNEDNQCVATPHGEGLNILKVDGSAKFGGKNVNWKNTGTNTNYYIAPYVYYSYNVWSASPPSSGITYTATNGMTGPLWRYYETGKLTVIRP